jgi:hypothetical protein
MWIQWLQVEWALWTKVLHIDTRFKIGPHRFHRKLWKPVKNCGKPIENLGTPDENHGWGGSGDEQAGQAASDPREGRLRQTGGAVVPPDGRRWEGWRRLQAAVAMSLGRALNLWPCGVLPAVGTGEAGGGGGTEDRWELERWVRAVALKTDGDGHENRAVFC